MNDEIDNSTEQALVFDMKMSDEDALTLLKTPLEESKTYWTDTQKLDIIRQANMNLWLPNHWKGKEVYAHQEDYLYIDNRIFTSVETIVSTVNARIPMPDVMPAQETMVAEQTAKDLHKAIVAHTEKHRTLDIFRLATRSLLINRVGIVKARWDASYGKNGDIVPEHVPPQDIIVDKDAKLNETPRFITHIIRNHTVEELIALFPEAEQKILKMAGVNRKDGKGNLVAYKSQLAKKHDVYETWVTYYDEGYQSGVIITDDKLQHVIAKMRNPNWNYEDELEDDQEEQSANLLDRPTPPFFTINYLNDGSSFIDQTSLIEQAAPLQRILNKRGLQIMENAEQSGSGMIFNTSMISKEEVARLVGAPDEKIGVNGDVRSAFARVSPPILPDYVMMDKMDARQEIDNIFATHEVTRGEDSSNKTLGQDQLQLQANLTRMDDVARAVEKAAAQYYKYLVQMMKVYYVEEHYFKATGEDGQFDFLVMKNDLIEDGVDVTVETGSTMPIDKAGQKGWAETLASTGMIDPLSLYEVGTGGNLPSPKVMLERFMLYVSDPMAFTDKVKQEEFDRNAYKDIQILLRGEVPELRDDITPQYLRMFTKYMTGGEFQNQPEIIKQLFAEFLKVAEVQAQKQLEALMTQLPTPEEMQASNQQAVEQAQMEQGMNPEMQGGGQPQEPVA